jgi:hypothetical protein
VVRERAGDSWWVDELASCPASEHGQLDAEAGGSETLGCSSSAEALQARGLVCGEFWARIFPFPRAAPTAVVVADL